MIWLDRSSGEAPLILLRSLIPQGSDCVAAARAVRVFPRGLRHVPAPDQHPGRTRDLDSQCQFYTSTRLLVKNS